MRRECKYEATQYEFLFLEFESFYIPFEFRHRPIENFLFECVFIIWNIDLWLFLLTSITSHLSSDDLLIGNLTGWVSLYQHIMFCSSISTTETAVLVHSCL